MLHNNPSVIMVCSFQHLQRSGMDKQVESYSSLCTFIDWSIINGLLKSVAFDLSSVWLLKEKEEEAL